MLLPLSNFKSIKIKHTDSTCMIGGIKYFRGKGFFNIYNYNAGILHEVFNSKNYKFCSDGIPLANRSLDCISYRPFDLNFTNKDYNGDNLLDLKFSGFINYYCKGLAIGFGRNDRKPIKTEKIDIQFYYKGNNTWELTSDYICSLLEKKL